eukprot:39330_1
MSKTNSYSVDLEWKHLDQTKFTFVTLCAAFGLRVVAYPLSLLKTNHQTRSIIQNNMSSNNESLIRTIFKTQGMRGFYKGITINLIGSSAGYTLHVTIYERTRELIQNRLNALQFSPSIAAPVASGLSGVIACGAQFSISTPFDIISQKRMILSGSDMNTTRAKCILQQLLHEEKSIFGLWRGLTLSLMTYAPTSGIVWASYRYSKPKMYKLLYDGRQDNPNHVLPNLMSGAIAGGLGGFLTIPLDTIKVRKQVLAKRSTKAIDIVKNVYNELGILGFWRGVVPRTCQYTITCAIIMTVYDLIKRVSKQ